MRVLLLLGLIPALLAEDLWLRRGRIWTADPENPWAESLLIRGNRIAAAGKDSELAKQAKGARVIELRGRLAVPGFNDAHLHFLGGSLGLRQLDLTGICSLEAMQKAVADFAARNPGTGWLEGRGWEYLCFPQGRLPRREDLDAVISNRPVFLIAYDGHTAWANSQALRVAGIDRNTTYPGYGEVVKDPDTGEPTGCFKEGAQGLIRRHVPAPDRARKLAALEEGMRLAASLGITSIQNANGNMDELGLYAELLKRNQLTLRASLAMSIGPMETDEAIREYAALRRQYGGPLLSVGALKISLDGVIESHTAAMLLPYTNNPATSGKPAWTAEQFRRMVALADSVGLQVYTHAIGDRAVRMALDGYESARRGGGRADARHRIEHIETIHPADLPRFAALGVLPSMQPIHADPSGIEVWSAAIGPERTRLGFAWRSIERAGGRLVFSSDWPASISLDPIRGIHSAVNRRTITGLPPGGWIPEERISVASALRAYTANAAFGGHREHIAGTLRAGLAADIAVLSQDLFSIAPIEIHKTRVELTVFDGKLVFQRGK